MSRWNGPAHKGAMRELRAKKRTEAEARNRLTAPEHRRQYRLNPANRLLADLFGPSDHPAEVTCEGEDDAR